MNLSLICVAGGTGVRYGGDKLAAGLAGSTVLGWSLRRLHEAFPAAPVIVAVGRARIEFWRQELAGEIPDIVVVEGGPRRQDSVRCAVSAVAGECDTVLIHDGARPLVHVDDVRAAVEGLGDAAGAVLCCRVADTVKRAAANGTVAETVPRGELRLAQTPQVFRRAALERAWRECDLEREWTDESAMIEAAGLSVRLVVARHANPKLTTAADLRVLEAMVEGGRA